MHTPREFLIQQTRPSPIDGSAHTGNTVLANTQDMLRHSHVAIKHYSLVSNSLNWSNAIATKHNVILNKTKLPTTAVKPNQFNRYCCCCICCCCFVCYWSYWSSCNVYDGMFVRSECCLCCERRYILRVREWRASVQHWLKFERR